MMKRQQYGGFDSKEVTQKLSGLDLADESANRTKTVELQATCAFSDLI